MYINFVYYPENDIFDSLHLIVSLGLTVLENIFEAYGGGTEC